MSTSNDEHPVPATLDAFEKVFEAIKELALIGQLSGTEDELLAGIVRELHDLHEQFGEREFLAAVAANGELDESDKDLRSRLRTRLVMQADIGRAGEGDDLSELAQQELLDSLGEDELN
jgi:hypothetical protein